MADVAFPTPTEFFLTIPLYAEKPFSGEDTWAVIDLLYYSGTYDNFCTQCGKDATFLVTPPDRPVAFRRDVHDMFQTHGMKPEFPDIKPDLYMVRSECTRNREHIQRFFFLVRRISMPHPTEVVQFRSTLQKIGQHPSYGDLNLPKVKTYSKVLDKHKLGELGRAIALASHDVGVGSYVYLRRVFEALVAEAHEAAKGELGWDEENYGRSRMPEKIRSLKDHLPSFLVEHPEVYSLLSKGIHELSEKECLEHFHALRLGIELILDQKLERQQREAKLREARDALSQAAGRHK